MIIYYGEYMNVYEYVNSKLDTIEDSEGSFDDRIINHINDTLAELTQIIKVEKFQLVDKNTSLEELYPSDDIPKETLQLILMYIGLSVRIAFDPPVGSILTSLEKSRDRIASRLTIAHNNEEANKR